MQRSGCLFVVVVAWMSLSACAVQPACVGQACEGTFQAQSRALFEVPERERHGIRTFELSLQPKRQDPTLGRGAEAWAELELAPRFTRVVSWNVQGRFNDASRTAAERWHAGIVLLNDQKRSDDHERWVREQSPAFEWFGDDYSIAGFGPELELLEPLTHPDFRAPVVHLRWRHGLDEFHLFTLHAQTPLGAPDRHWKFLREADLLVDAIGRVSGHWHTIIAGDFNSRSPIDGETEYIHSVARLLNAGYIDTFAALHPGQFEPTKLHGNNTGRRIDYVFVSDDLRPALVGAGIDTKTSYPQNSDHRPVWADLDLSRLTPPASGS